VAAAVAITFPWQGGCGHGSAQESSGVDPSVCRAYFEAVNAYFPACDSGPAIEEPWPNALFPTADEAGFAAAYCGGFAKAPGAQPMADEMRACAAWLASPAACHATYGSVDVSCYLRGTLATNAPCASGVQCQSGVCAPPTGGGPAQFCGRCAELVGSGASCLQTSASDPQKVCDVGLICSGLGKCVAPVKAGEACSSDQSTPTYLPCVLGLICDLPSGKGGSQVCRAPGGVGEACTEGICGFNLYCVNGVCSAAAGEGQPCSAANGCAAGLYCPAAIGIDAGALGNVCTSIPVVGAGALCLPPNDHGYPPECEAGLQCSGSAGSVCAPFPAVGSKCPPSGCGTWLVCANGTCQPPDASQCH